MSEVNPAITKGDIADASEQPKKRFVDAETLRAYDEYLADWRWRMSTWINLQREYKGTNVSIRNENIF